MQQADVIVIGGGIAGASAAAELAENASVVVLEAEEQPGFHATGRSAAYLAVSYGKPVVQKLTASCEAFFESPPPGFSDVELIRLRETYYIGRQDQAESLKAMKAGDDVLTWADEAEVLAKCPVLRPGYVHAALRDPRGGDLDVDALLQACLRQFRRRGGQLVTAARVSELSRQGGSWRVVAGGQSWQAPVVINAAGAWADRVAELAGLAPLGIQPMRRTALTVDPPEGMLVSDWPNMMDVDDEFYFKPEAGKVLISPADETPTPPCDAQPEDLDVAIGVDRYEQATGQDIRHVDHSWAGLRTFAPDRIPVVGEDPRSEGFFWLAGQGGYGIGCAPALARMVRFLLQGDQPTGSFAPIAALAPDLSPKRLIQ